MFLCTSAFRHKYLFTEMISERGTFSRRRSQTGAFEHRDAFSHGCFFYMPLLLHTSPLMERCFCPQMLLHGDTLAKHSGARAFIQRQLYAEIYSHRDASAQRCLHAQKHFYTHIVLHRDEFTL